MQRPALTADSCQVHSLASEWPLSTSLGLKNACPRKVAADFQSERADQVSWHAVFGRRAIR